MNDIQRNPGRRAAVLLPVLLLSACAALPSRDTALPPVPVPQAWSAATVAGSVAAPAAPTAAQTSLADWWRRFGDPRLAALVGQALEANASVRSARAALAQARALRDVRAAGLAPSLGGSASAQRARAGAAGTSNTFRAGLDASWELDVFGGARSGVEAAEADARVAQASLADAQVSLAAEVALAWFELRGAQARLAIARGNFAAQAETLQLARWRAQAGLASSIEVEQARAAVEQTGAQLPVLERTIAQAQHALAVLAGQAPGALREALGTAPLPRAPDELALAIPAETLRQRPDVRAAEHRVSAALARVAQADAERYPGFRLGGSFGLAAPKLGDLLSGAAIANALLASVTVPLLDGGAARAQVRAQEAALEQARIGYQGTVLAALREVEDALVALRSDRERLERLRGAADAAANAALLAQQRYASGLIDFQVVLETQRTLLSTQDGVAGTEASVGADHVRLYKALGGGWRDEELR